jgi:putative ABC transport system permease protein
VLRLALQTMRSRQHGFVGAFVAVTFAVTIMTACGILIESGARARPSVERYARAPVIVAGEQTVAVDVDGQVETERIPERVRIPMALAEPLAAIEGVRAVVPDRSVPTTVVTKRGRVLAAPGGGTVFGHGWRSAALTPYTLTSGRAPSSTGEVVLDVALAAQGDIDIGDDVLLTSTEGTWTYAVVGLARPPRGSRPQGMVFLSDERAASLSVDPDRVDAFALLLDETADPVEVAGKVERTMGEEIAVLTGLDRGVAESQASALRNEDLVALGGAFGSIATMLAVFVLAATLGLSVLQRGRELALLRAVGAKPRQIRTLLVGEALIVAIVAGLTGVAPGILLASSLFDALQSRGIGAETANLVVSPLPPMIAIGTGAFTAALAAWLAGRRAARIRPTAALTEAAVEPKRIGRVRLLVGLGFLAGGAALCVTALSLQGESAAAASLGVVMILLIAVGLLGPFIARIAAAVVGPGVAALFPTSGLLAVANIRIRARRFASTSTPIALGVAISLTLIGIVTVEGSATEKQSRERTLADRALTAPGGLPSGLVNEIGRFPGVVAVTGLIPTQVGAVYREVGDPIFDFLPAVGVSSVDLGQTLELDVRQGSIEPLPANGVAVSVDRARSLEVGVGEQIPLWLCDGRQITPRVVATYASALGLGEFVLPRAIVEEHVTDPMDTQILVKYANGADVAAVDARLAALAGRIPGLQVLDRALLRVAEDREAQAKAWVNYLIIGVLMSFLAIAAVNSLVMAVGERTRELALLRLVGATPSQAIGTFRLEVLALTGFAIIMGLAVAAATLVPFSIAIAGSAVPYLPWHAVAAVIAGAILLGVCASELATRNAMRRDPIELIGADE